VRAAWENRKTKLLLAQVRASDTGREMWSRGRQQGVRKVVDNENRCCLWGQSEETRRNDDQCDMLMVF